MTSNSLSTKTEPHAGKRGAFLLHSLRSYWWIAVICSVVYGFAGPVFTMLKLDSVTAVSNVSDFSAEEFLLETQMAQLVRWFRMEGFLPLYFSAIVLAAVIGCVMFFYLQQKKQVNFYHSQPITRTRLFLNQYAAGLILNIVPLLVMTAVSFVVVAAYGMGGIIHIGAILQHTMHMLLLLLASYSIAVFAGQLAGTMATHMAINAVLHFGVPVGAWIVSMMHDLFFATYTGSQIIENSLKFSPVCAAVQHMNGVSYVPESAVMVTAPMAGSMIAVLLGMTILLSLFSWFLYQKRPSEAAGKALVYPVSEPVLKAYLMFIVSIAAGLVFQAVGSKMFFYFAVVSFAILTHMTCEVIIQNDFKAMGRRLSHCAVILVLILGIVGVFRFDLLGYDSFLPEPDEVQRVSLMVQGAENTSVYSEDGYYTSDPAVKQGVYDLLYPVVTEELYRSSSFTGNSYPAEVENVKTTAITVQYQMKNGTVKHRIYRAVTADSIEENYAKLYNQQVYREAIYADIIHVNPEDIYSMGVSNHQVYDRDKHSGQRVVETVEVSYDKEIAVTTRPAVETYYETQTAESAYQTMTAILHAYAQDVKERQFDSLKKAREYSIEIQIRQTNKNNRYYYFEVPVYEDDKHTMAILSSMNLKEHDHSYSDALIFRCEPSRESELRTLMEEAHLEMDNDNATVEACKELLRDKAELTGHINGVENVNRFIQESNLMKNSGIFAEYDDSHIVLLRYYNLDRNDWNSQLFYKDTVPVQYQ